MRKRLMGINREYLVLGLILAVAAFFRLYRIGEFMTFLGDEGRDAIIVRRLLVDFDPILIGPGTSIGNMYLGPLYYYLIAPSLLLANFSPVGPSVFVAILGVATVYLVWRAAREWFGKNAAIISSLLYAVSPTVIIYSRSSWNPNIMPFFALLSVYGIWKVWREENYKWLVVSACSFAFVLQSHYLGLLLLPTLGIFWGLSLLKGYRSGRVRKIIAYSAVSAVIFGFLMSPLVIFDMRHGWINTKAVNKFFTERQTTVSARPWRALPQIWPLTEEVSTRLVAGRNELVGSAAAIFLVAVVLWLSGAKKIKMEESARAAVILILVWVGFGLLGLGLYKQEIYDHYYGFFFAAPFLLLGGMMEQVIRSYKFRGGGLVLAAVTTLLIVNLINTPIKGGPNRQLQRTREVAMKIEKEAGGEDFNLAVIAERNYEDAYQYFLEKEGAGVVDIDPLRTDETIKEQLFVVCEMAEEKCDPTHNPKAEVANFGWSQVEERWGVAGVLVYKLVHTE